MPKTPRRRRIGRVNTTPYANNPNLSPIRRRLNYNRPANTPGSRDDHTYTQPPPARVVSNEQITQKPAAHKYDESTFITQTNIGCMDKVCSHCNARKFKGESPGFC